MDTIEQPIGLSKNRNFILTALGAVESNIAAVFYNAVVSFWILALTNNNPAIQGLYLGVTGIFFILASPLGGVISDKFNKAKILWICDYARAAVILLTLGLILLIDNNLATIIILFVGGAIGNIIGAVFNPSSSALIPEVVAVEDLQKANSVAGITTAIQTIIGVTLVGLLYSVLDIKWILVMVSAFYCFSAFTEMFIKSSRVSGGTLTAKNILSDLKETLIYVNKEKAILTLLILLIFLNLFLNPVQTNFFPFFCQTDIASTPDFLLSESLNPEIWQTIFCVSIAIASIVAALLATKIPMRQPVNHIRIGFIIFSLASLAMAFTYFYLVRQNNELNIFLLINIGLCLLLGAGTVFVNVPTAVLLQTNVERGKYGKVMSLVQIGAQGISPIMYIISGLILKAGSEYLLFTLAIGLVLTTLMAIFARSLRKI